MPTLADAKAMFEEAELYDGVIFFNFRIWTCAFWRTYHEFSMKV